jgi:hypothetical protein
MMEGTRKLRTTVQPGGRIEVSAPDLPVGQTVDVVVSIPPRAARRSVAEILARAPGHRLFTTPDEVDAYIRTERESWND